LELSAFPPSDQSSGIDDGQYIRGGSRVEESHCRADARPSLADAGKQGKDGAGTDGQEKPCRDRDRIRNVRLRLLPKIAQNLIFGKESRHGPGYEKSRNQAVGGVGQDIIFEGIEAPVNHLGKKFHLL
jgi:hypothetical protein